MSVRPIIALLAAATLAACSPPIDMDAERASLREADLEWAAVASEGTDVDRIVSYWSDDATVFPPEAPLVNGKAAIREFVSQSLSVPGFAVSWQPAEVVVAPGGDLGYTTGENSFTFPGDDGNLVTVRGRYVAVWRKTADGRWECVIDIWNAGPGSPAM